MPALQLSCDMGHNVLGDAIHGLIQPPKSTLDVINIAHKLGGGRCVPFPGDATVLGDVGHDVALAMRLGEPLLDLI